jgi:hypothetical protein
MKSGGTRLLIEQFISLRLVIGFLGEKKQRAWWDCAFLNSVGIRFLSETFPRTARAAALRSTTEAARLSHDAAIGRLGTFHLFRLPTELEDRIEAELDRLDLSDQQFSISSMEEALDRLKSFVKNPLSAPQGPVQVGVEPKILTANSVAELAAHYHSAFSNGFFCFPYFVAHK